jgi:hypothetical protein
MYCLSLRKLILLWKDKSEYQFHKYKNVKRDTTKRAMGKARKHTDQFSREI